MTSTDPRMPVVVLLTEHGHGDLSIGHSHGTFWRVPRDHTRALRRALTDALTGCGLHLGAGHPGHWGDAPDLPMLPAGVAVWRRADDALTLTLDADDHHLVSTEHTAALRHAILAALHERATDPVRDPEPPWPTTGPAPSITAPITGSPPADPDHRPGQ